MSGAHCVVVWEWHDSHEGVWLPHSPAVTRALERAHVKKLTRVVLADADPDLKGHCVNLRTLTQTYDVPEGGVVECGVRRGVYCGCGARWQWQRRASWHPLPMEVQCQLEEAWCRDADEPVAYGGWWLWAGRLQATPPAPPAAPRPPRALRRDPQPPYPTAPPARTAERKPRIPQQHTGSSVHSIQSVQSMQSLQSHHSVRSHHSMQSNHSVNSNSSLHSNHSSNSNQGTQQHGARVASTRASSKRKDEEIEVTKDRKQKGLARQILHNLNIFSHNNKPSCAGGAGGPPSPAPPAPPAPREDARARRHSVDTVSTYLSHESKDSSQAGGSLLDCSGSNHDVFLSPPQSPPPAARPDAAWLEPVRTPQWGAVCPECLAPLQPAAAAAEPVVALPGCRHMLHLRCLSRQDTSYIECLVCGQTYGPKPPPPPSDRCLEPERLHALDPPLPRRLHEHSHLQRIHDELNLNDLPEQLDLHNLQLSSHLQENLNLNHLQDKLNLHNLRELSDLPAPVRLRDNVLSLRDNLEDLEMCDDQDDHYVQDFDEGEARLAWAASASPQPPGSMSWSVRPRPAPGYPPHARSILVTYNFQSGRQSAGHPAPGAPYYAVGFPRHTQLPDTPQGRQVLAALRRCWELGLLFTVTASQTTGREHVVAWQLPAPAPPLPRLLRSLQAALAGAPLA